MASVQAIMSRAEVELVRVLRGGDHPHALADLVGRSGGVLGSVSGRAGG